MELSEADREKPKPYLNKWGDLVIPYNSDSKYWWWAGGQSIGETLKELEFEKAKELNGGF